MEDYRNAVNTAVALLILISVLALIFAAWLNRFDPILTKIVFRNFAAIIGLPFAFIGSFAIVALFRQTEGPINFEGFGMKLSGSSGQIVLWVICFLAIAGAIKLLWHGGPSL
ncbi:hypothetical protein E3C22_20495 [Jiella endophytica]|uniref:Uncharacterized protein n=1 Tax=Jiella endophytica TaxID=2558362 RepID=A0A4Y8RBL5_9HYPH|nr:hypothetical protein [Jiella endophytica]TFF19149.1 hypothetical protein E3C22_20495 [Jiella endophytica]